MHKKRSLIINGFRLALFLISHNGERHPGYSAFEPLRDVEFFKLARADHGTVAWPQEIVFDPDTFYLESQPVPFKQAA